MGFIVEVENSCLGRIERDYREKQTIRPRDYRDYPVTISGHAGFGTTPSTRVGVVWSGHGWYGLAREYQGVTVEVESCYDCENHCYCTRHIESKYTDCAERLKAALDRVRVLSTYYELVKNPGPKSRGMNCKRVEYNPFMYVTMVMNPNTRRWMPDESFRYPRIGAFEVSVIKVNQRVEVFSKLKTGRWPNAEWLARKIDEVVQGRFASTGGWAEAPLEKKKPERRYSTKKMTDDELREMIKSKFKTIISAFRSFDKNLDGMVNKSEFVKGMRQSGVDLPPAQMQQLWEMADEDGTGALHYQEFARKFAAYKATGSLHRHTSIAKGDEKLVAMHGVGAASRVQKHAAIRDSDGQVAWGVEEHELATEEETQARKEQKLTVSAMARDPNLAKIPVNEMTPDQIRARILQKHGSLVNAFRHFDTSGDSRVGYDEFLHHLPKVLGEPISLRKVEELWQSMDHDMGGELDIHEFSDPNSKNLSTSQGAKLFKGQAVTVTRQAHEGLSGADTMVDQKRMNFQGKDRVPGKRGSATEGSPTGSASEATTAVSSAATLPTVAETSSSEDAATVPPEKAQKEEYPTEEFEQ